MGWALHQHASGAYRRERNKPILIGYMDDQSAWCRGVGQCKFSEVSLLVQWVIHDLTIMWKLAELLLSGGLSVCLSACTSTVLLAWLSSNQLSCTDTEDRRIWDSNETILVLERRSLVCLCPLKDDLFLYYGKMYRIARVEKQSRDLRHTEGMKSLQAGQLISPSVLQIVR